ncbi:MAG: peptide ABC transporter substrate-binding protein [Gemmatimonadaceae bacterium]
MRLARFPSTALAALAAASVLAAALVACGKSARPPGTVVYASGADLESANPLVTIHPLSRQVQRYVLFVTLARYDDSLNAVPYAARSWTWSGDRRTLTLHLVPSLRWHDGTPTTARDVAFTIEAARDPATGFARHADLAGVTQVIAPDDSTIVVRFADPQARFPVVLCELPIVPAHLLENVARRSMRRASFNRSPVGNGPFRFVERRTGQRWVFERNPAFPRELGGAPSLERLVIAVVDEATTKFAGLVAGDLDVAGIAPTMASLAAQDPTLRVVNYPVLFSYGVVFNTHRPPFDDERVRKAVALAIDRQRIVDVALAGYASVAHGPVPPDHPYAATEGTGPDPAAARARLDAAGWHAGADGIRRKNGQELAFRLLTVGSADNAAEQLMQADLAAVGIRMEIGLREMTAFLAEARAAEKRFDALFTGIPGDLSLAYLSSMFDSRLAGSALDYGDYHTPALDLLLERARSAATPNDARRAWLEAQRELEARTPIAWIYHARGVQGAARRLRGVTMDLRGEMVSVARWHLDADDSSPSASR